MADSMVLTRFRTPASPNDFLCRSSTVNLIINCICRHICANQSHTAAAFVQKYSQIILTCPNICEFTSASNPTYVTSAKRNSLSSVIWTSINGRTRERSPINAIMTVAPNPLANSVIFNHIPGYIKQINLSDVAVATDAFGTNKLCRNTSPSIGNPSILKPIYAVSVENRFRRELTYRSTLSSMQTRLTKPRLKVSERNREVIERYKCWKQKVSSSLSITV